MRPANEFMELRQHPPNPSNAMYRTATQALRSALKVLIHGRREPVGYFSVPAEIRNEIMRLVFLRDDVYIRETQELGVKAKIKGPWEARSYPEISPKPSLPGFQLLVTCKQAYAEGGHMYHGSNTVFLPPDEFDGLLKNLFKHL